jgi:hypothetical protein
VRRRAWGPLRSRVGFALVGRSTLGAGGRLAAGHCPAAIGRARTWYAYATLNNDTTTAEIVALSGDGSPDSLLPWDRTAGRRDGHEDHSDRSNF